MTWQNMMIRLKSMLTVSVLSISCIGLSACVQAYKYDKTTSNIINAEYREWPSFGRDYANQRHSPLKQIDRANDVGPSPSVPARIKMRNGVSASITV